jgi:hypothetical protein
VLSVEFGIGGNIFRIGGSKIWGSVGCPGLHDVSQSIKAKGKIYINQTVLCSIWKQTLKSEIKILLLMIQ